MSSLWHQFADPEFQLGLSLALGMIVFQCLVAIWAAVSKVHWFWRSAALWAAIMLMAPIRAWEAAWLFGISSPLTVALIVLGHWLTSPRRKDVANPPDQTPARWRFSLLDLLLATVVAGLWIHGAKLVVRSYQPRNWIGCLVSSIALAALAAISYAVARPPRRWADVTLLCVALLAFEGALALSQPFFGVIAGGAVLTAYGCALDRRHWAAVLLLACLLPASAAAVCWAGVWMRHFDPLNITNPTSVFDRPLLLTILAEEIVSLLLIALGLVRATVTRQFWLPWRIFAGAALACVLGVAMLGVGGIYVRLLQRTRPLMPVVKLQTPHNHYDRIMEIGRAIGTIHPAATTFSSPSRPDTKTAQELKGMYEELFGLLGERNSVPYEPDRDATAAYEEGPIGNWDIIRALMRSLQAEADWAVDDKRPDDAIDFALTMIRLGDMLGRGGVALDCSFAYSSSRMGYVELARLRTDFPADRVEQTMAALRRTLAEREDSAALQARDADYEEKAYGWGLRLEALLSGNEGQLRFGLAEAESVWGHFATTMNILLQADLAVRQFERDISRLPASLDELVPKYLPAWPRDSNGELLRYRTEGEQFVLYSIGWDKHDDGGKFGRLGEYFSSCPNGRRESTWSARPTFDLDIDTWSRE